MRRRNGGYRVWMVGNTPKDRMALRVGEGKFVLISGFSRLATGTAITLAQSSEGVNPLGTEAVEITGNGNGRGNKRWK